MLVKNTLHFFLTFTALLLTCSTALTQNQHLGLWKGIDETGKVGHINLDTTGYAYFILGKDTLGGESFVLDGYEAYMTYQVDYAETPKTIDFTIFLKNEDLEVGKLPGIFKFDEKGSMTLCVNFDGEVRPETFAPEDSIELERVSTKQYGE